jgi:superfamily II DNA or RNA helicase
MIQDERYGLLRSHQWEGKALAEDIINGRRTEKVFVASVTPGGGKNRLAAIFAHELLDACIVDAVCIIGPNDALRHQTKLAFHDPAHGLPRHINAEGNKSLGSTQQAIFAASGYVTTYAAVVRAVKRHIKRFMGKRYLLVLDEPHHLADAEHAQWAKAIRELKEFATLTLLMSGTLRRHDGERIPFVEYDEDTKRAKPTIKYTRRQALEEHAVLQAFFRLTDGTSHYDYRNRSHRVALKEASKKETGRALKAALLDPEFRAEFACKALDDWLDFRRNVYQSRMIVICHSQDAAKQMAKSIKERLGTSFQVALCVSDAPRSQRALRRFRENGECHVLVTVNMAYEGLDVPDVTHLVCLTDKRSEPWLEQAFARATRVDPNCGRPWEQQLAYIYVPDDPPMRGFIDRILEEQEETFREKGEGGVAPKHWKSSFRPYGAEMGGDEYADLHGRLSPEENEIVDEARGKFPALRHLPPREILKLGEHFRGAPAAAPAPKPPTNGAARAG